MAKQQEGAIRIYGKLGDNVYTRGGKYGPIVRKVVKAGSKKDEPMLKEQYSRTQYLNAIASDINTMIKEYGGLLKSSQFYVEVQRQFRTERENNRLLLLCSLVGLEVNGSYPFSGHGRTVVTATPGKKELLVVLRVDMKPQKGKWPVDSYCYEVVVSTWMNNEEPGDCEQQLSEWVKLKDSKPAFEFHFPKSKGALHWMVTVRIRLGKNGIPYESNQCDGMQITNAGSFSAREQEWLQTREKQTMQQEAVITGRRQPDVVRVKPKRKE